MSFVFYDEHEFATHGVQSDFNNFGHGNRNKTSDYENCFVAHVNKLCARAMRELMNVMKIIRILIFCVKFFLNTESELVAMRNTVSFVRSMSTAFSLFVPKF